MSEFTGPNHDKQETVVQFDAPSDPLEHIDTLERQHPESIDLARQLAIGDINHFGGDSRPSPEEVQKIYMNALELAISMADRASKS